MTPKNKRALIAASIIGSLLNAYEKQERNKIHETLRLRAKKGIRRSVAKYGQEAIDAINLGDKVWKSAIDNFKLTYIEASAFILLLSYKDSKLLSRDYDLGQGILGQWAKPSKAENAVELEANTSEVCRFIFDEINRHLGIEEDRTSIMEKLGKTA